MPINQELYFLWQPHFMDGSAKNNKSANWRSIKRFFLVGVLATLVHYSVLKTIEELNIIPSIAAANVLAYFVSLVIAYIGNRYFVFDAKRSHLEGFTTLVAGYLIAISVHTLLLVGLTNGAILDYLAGPLGEFGGGFLLSIWYGLLDLVSPWLAERMTGQRPNQISTTLGFLAATSVSATMTYFWNRFVVFQHKAG